MLWRHFIDIDADIHTLLLPSAIFIYFQKPAITRPSLFTRQHKSQRLPANTGEFVIVVVPGTVRVARDDVQGVGQDGGRLGAVVGFIGIDWSGDQCAEADRRAVRDMSIHQPVVLAGRRDGEDRFVCIAGLVGMPDQLEVAVTDVSQQEQLEVRTSALPGDDGFGLGVLADFEVVAVAAALLHTGKGVQLVD
ncbi:hypothetical protein A7D27_23280 [Pseudomonas sp. 1D4]|nr:hypothetical protein A7D27_23280 [Pseudomonas sp. 1D4]OEC52113.1 hypothetical protein A9G05_22425 [Pseudomonas sp. ENNP23]